MSRFLHYVCDMCEDLIQNLGLDLSNFYLSLIHNHSYVNNLDLNSQKIKKCKQIFLRVVAFKYAINRNRHLDQYSVFIQAQISPCDMFQFLDLIIFRFDKIRLKSLLFTSKLFSVSYFLSFFFFFLKISLLCVSRLKPTFSFNCSPPTQIFKDLIFLTDMLTLSIFPLSGLTHSVQ